MLYTTRLHQTLVDAGLPVASVGCSFEDAGPWVVSGWSTTPTPAQRTQAAALIAAFDPSPAAHAAFLDAQDPALADLRDRAAQAVADIDTYLASAGTATAAQVRAEVEALDRRQKRVIQALLRVVKKVWG